MFDAIMKSGSKILLTIFILVFFVSNTGLPFSIHLCQMMQDISVESCDMCSVHKSCCSDVDEVKITKAKAACCETKIAAEPLKDSYISINEIIFTDIYVIEIVEILSGISDKTKINHSVFTDGSPPGFTNQEKFLLNSTFLI
jgi:hypothetical protein